MKTNVAILGCGYWGRNFLRLLSRHPNVNLVAACDPEPERLAETRELYPDLQLTDDWHQLLDLEGLQAVVISTPVTTHFELVDAFLRRKIHVLCEKPLCLSSEEAAELTSTAGIEGCVLMTGHTFLFHPAIRHIKSLIHGQSFGRPLYMHFQRTGLGIVRRDVDTIWDVAPHDISILLYLLDEKPAAVTAFGMSLHRPHFSEVAFIILEYASGMMVKVHVSWLDPIKTRKVTLVGENQMIVFDDVSPSEKVTIYQKSNSYQPTSGEFGEFQAAMRAGDIYIPHLPSNEPLRVEVDEFLEAMQTGVTPISGGQFSTEVIRILEAAAQSIRQGNQRILLS